MSTWRLWAPWRLGYISSARNKAPSGCLFCREGRASNRANEHIIYRGRLGYTLLNRFPYNNGHLMIVPYRHVGRLEALTPEEWLELLDLAKDAMTRLKKALHPHGFNLGINFGRVAGAGIPGHLHLHIVPRWVGDTNFMPVLADTKVISQSLASAARLLRKAHPKRAG